MSDSNFNENIVNETEISISNENLEIQKEQRENKKFKKTVLITVIISVAAVILFFIAYFLFDILGIGFSSGKDCKITISHGASTAEIASTLQDEGIVKTAFAFRLYSKLNGYDGKYKYGEYYVNTNDSYKKIANTLMTDGAKTDTVTVTIPEGTGINDYIKNVNGQKVVIKGIATILEEKGVCTKSEFSAALNRVQFNGKFLSNCNIDNAYYPLEGYLFPDTYEFYADGSTDCADKAIEKMIKNAESKITDNMYKRADEMGYSINEILTMASIVQMEAGNRTDEMKNVSAVFYNRLSGGDTGGILGSSPTLFYGDSFENDDGRYNTQKDSQFNAIKGIPPGPMCSPGLDAINAALYPTENTDYYYFVTDSKGNFYYHKTLAEQNQTISKLKGQNNWTYENY